MKTHENFLIIQLKQIYCNIYLKLEIIILKMKDKLLLNHSFLYEHFENQSCCTIVRLGFMSEFFFLFFKLSAHLLHICAQELFYDSFHAFTMKN